MNKVSFCSAIVMVATAALMVTGCSKANKAECEQMVDKMIDLQVQGLSPDLQKLTKSGMADEKPKMVADCDGKVSKSDVQCVMNAKTSADLDKCK